MADYDKEGMGGDELRYFFQSNIQSFCNPTGHNIQFVAYNSTYSAQLRGFSWLLVRSWIAILFAGS